MAKNEWSTNTPNPNMLFDLRQTYAMKILTPILEEIEEQRRANNFINWFEELTENLFVNIYQKLDEEEMEAYMKEKEKVINIINKYPNEYQGRSYIVQNNYILKQAILKLEMWMKQKMEEKGLFGKGGEEYDWDEI